jgi:cobalt-zinc-cadmium efflux system outer membrane protein
MSVHALALFALLEATAPGSADEVARGSDAITLDDAVRLAGRAPIVEAAEADVGIAEAQEWQARLLPNPEVSYQGYARVMGTPDAINGQQHQVDLGGPLLVAGQRRARMRATRLQTAAVRGQTCVARVEIQREAALRWVALLSAQETIKTLSGGRTELQRAYELTRARASRGAQTEYDAERVAAELRALESELRVAHVELRDASHRLAIVLGRPQWTPRASGTLDAVAGRAVAVGEDPELHGIPVVDLARRAERAAAAGEVVAKRERWPVPSIYGGVYGTTDGDSASMTFGLSLPLPVFDRGQAGVARARAETRRARLRTTAVERVARGEYDRAVAVVRDREEALQQWQEHLAEAVPRLRAMAREAYAGGVSSVLELIDAERTHLQARLRGLELSRAVALARIDLDAARGVLGEPCR